MCSVKFNGYIAVGEANDANSIVSDSIVNTLLLDDSDDTIKFSNVELTGQFALISDMDSQSNLPPMVFSDAKVQKLANVLHNSVVMLLLETPSCYVFCRKDIGVSELQRNQNNVAHHKYAMFAKLIGRLKSGEDQFISRKSTGEKKPIFLHTSLKEYF